MRKSLISCLLALLSLSTASAARPDPDMARLLQVWSSIGGRPLSGLTPQQARAIPDLATAVAVMRRKGAEPAAVLSVARVYEKQLPGPAGPLSARVYQPAGSGPFPLLVYFHGGGFVVGNLQSADASARAIANGAGCVVVSVGYRQAPEHPYPAALKDAYAAWSYVSKFPKEFDGDPRRVAIGGEHSGANLAAAVCIMALDQRGRMPIHQLLIGPITSVNYSSASYRTNRDQKPYGTADLQWFMKHYLRRASDSKSPYVSLLRRASADLPPATILVGALDPLRSDAEGYHHRLLQSGGDSTLVVYPGVGTDFFAARGVVAKAKKAQDFAAARLQKAFTLSAPRFVPRRERAVEPPDGR